MEKFPSLVDADGWQVVSQQQFDRDPNENLGSAWRDRAKAAIPVPAPVAFTSAWGTTAATKRRDQKQKGRDMTESMTQPEADYDFRHRRGEQRAWNRSQFGRASLAASAVANSDYAEIAE